MQRPVGDLASNQLLVRNDHILVVKVNDGGGAGGNAGHATRNPVNGYQVTNPHRPLRQQNETRDEVCKDLLQTKSKSNRDCCCKPLHIVPTNTQARERHNDSSDHNQIPAERNQRVARTAINRKAPKNDNVDDSWQVPHQRHGHHHGGHTEHSVADSHGHARASFARSHRPHCHVAHNSKRRNQVIPCPRQSSDGDKRQEQPAKAPQLIFKARLFARFQLASKVESIKRRTPNAPERGNANGKKQYHPVTPRNVLDHRDGSNDITGRSTQRQHCRQQCTNGVPHWPQYGNQTRWICRNDAREHPMRRPKDPCGNSGQYQECHNHRPPRNLLAAGNTVHIQTGLGNKDRRQESCSKCQHRAPNGRHR